MVAFELADHERMVQQAAHDFAKTEIRPVAASYDEHEQMPYDLIKRLPRWVSASGEGSLLETSNACMVIGCALEGPRARSRARQALLARRVTTIWHVGRATGHKRA